MNYETKQDPRFTLDERKPSILEAKKTDHEETAEKIAAMFIENISGYPTQMQTHALGMIVRHLVNNQNNKMDNAAKVHEYETGQSAILQNFILNLQNGIQ
jgi:hypothetical protein